jgi:hypothetical protein
MSFVSEPANAKRLLGLVLIAWSTVGGAQPLSSDAELAQRVAVIEARVGQAESLRAIKRLQYAYGHYVEFGLWHDFADLFTEDAVAHYPAGDLGREAIRELFFEQVGQGQLGLADGRLYPHFVLQPVVTLDTGGGTAHGRWHVLTLLGGYGGNATWVGGLYENDYVREDGVWKIAELRTNTQFSGSYAGGWTNPPPASAEPNGVCENYLVNQCTIPFHYLAEKAGAPLDQADAVAPVADASGFEGLGGQVAEIYRRVLRLRAESEVTNLQHAYGYYMDRKLWDDVADLFASDATLELGLQGVYRGRASIRRALEQFGPPGLSVDEVNDHLQLETIVTVSPDGGIARARGIDFALWGTEVDGTYRSEWREAVFENVYREEGGVWKIASMHLYPRFATDYSLGWAEDARPAPRTSEAYPPDEPPTLTHGVYPEFYIPPFHFTNPVTGRPPQYPEGTAQRIPADPVPAELVDRMPVADSESVEAIRARLTEIERLLASAVAHDAIENVANAYNYYLDEFDRDAASELFVAGVSMPVVSDDVAGGREVIRAAMNMPLSGGGRPAGFFVIHQTTQPVINVSADGRNARIRLRLLASSGRVGEAGAWIAGVYEGDAVIDNGTWKLSRMPIHYAWAADYLDGWASAVPYAKIGNVPFHYDNPVSGRPRPQPSD